LRVHGSSPFFAFSRILSRRHVRVFIYIICHKKVRPRGLRVELEKRVSSKPVTMPVVHNYGHGGSGWTIMHGTANAAANLVDQAMRKTAVASPTSRL
jgi:hypothetical protein